MNDWEILKEKGNEEFKKKNYQAAINFYSQAIELNGNEEVLYGNRALCNKSLNKLRQAVHDLNNALKLNPKNTKYIKRLAQIQNQLGNFGDADILLQKCINLEPKDPSHLTELNAVKTHISDWDSLQESKKKEDWKKCEEICEKLLKDCPDYSQLKLIHVQSLLNNVKIQQAIEFLLSKVTAEEKSNEEFDYLLVLAFYYDGKYDKAKKLLSTLLQRTKDNENMNHLWKILKVIEQDKEKANESFKNGRYQEAMDQYGKLLELDPNNRNFNSTIYANRALCHQKLNNYMDALKDINKSISLNENYTKAYVRRGNIYMALKMYEEAKYDFQMVKEKEPSNRDVIKVLEEAKKLEKQAKKRDYYKILDLEKNANENDIRKAYKKLALKWHPDRNNESDEQRKMAEKTFRDINDAYSVLSDAKKKEQYDSGFDPLNPEEASAGPGMDFSSSGMQVNPEDIFKMFFGGAGGKNGGFNMGNTGSFSFGGNQGHGGGFEDIFGGGGFPGGFGGFSQGGSRSSGQQKRSTNQGQNRGKR